MATPINTSFTSYQLTPQEFTTGSILSFEQKCCIQNYISQVAEMKMNMIFDPADITRSLQQQAELQGRLLALQQLLDTSQTVEEQLSANQPQE